LVCDGFGGVIRNAGVIAANGLVLYFQSNEDSLAGRQR
jgi:hypothetical protein